MNNIKIYFAPMEGVAGYLFRNAYNEIFHGIDKYFSPFISTSPNGIMKMKEFRDILPENNSGINLVPQLLSNNADDFIKASKELEQFGYDEININLGCPSGTVVTKGKGSGFLKKPEDMDKFFENIFDKCSVKISAKTRIGYFEAEEWQELLKVYNRYPFYELIIHPRTREDLYKNKVKSDAYRYAIENSDLSLCYNGDIFSVEDCEKICGSLGKIEKIMLGRGILKNPCIPEMIKENNSKNIGKIFQFHDRLYEEYKGYMSGELPVLFKMKELWMFLAENFENSEKLIKRIKKSKNLREYYRIIEEIKE